MNKETQSQIEEFVKKAMEEISYLRSQLAEANEKKAAEQEERDEELSHAVKQAAAALYDSDFINDEYDKRRFVKKATQDPKYLATVIQKICQAADVSTFGEVANVKTAGDLTDDPVMRKAFGYDANYNLLDE
jgi:DNA repair exonuclease SbcCD ATPase subunit